MKIPTLSDHPFLIGHLVAKFEQRRARRARLAKWLQRLRNVLWLQ